MSKKRIDAIRKKTKTENLDGFVVTHLDHVRYLSGYTGSNGLLVITNREAQFLTDFRYTDQARKEVTGAKVKVIEKGDLIGNLADFPEFNKKNLRLGYSSGYLPVAGAEQLKSVLSNALLIPADYIMSDLGWVKDRDEIASTRRAVKISDIAFERILPIITPGVRERELAAELEYQMAMLGSEKPAFESIVASGPRSAMPHGVATSRKIKKGDLITFDFGATVNGYVSDITRTVVLGKATSRQKRIYGIVLRSQLAGIKKVKAGIAGKDVDDVCRKIISKAGYGKQFGHGTGHGIGFYIHMGPRLAPKSENKLAVNQIFTIEPGIYISGWGGVRIEDDVLVTRKGGEVLNKAPKNLLEL